MILLLLLLLGITSADFSFFSDRLDDSLDHYLRIKEDKITRGNFRNLLKISNILVDAWKDMIWLR